MSVVPYILEYKNRRGVFYKNSGTVQNTAILKARLFRSETEKWSEKPLSLLKYA